MLSIKEKVHVTSKEERITKLLKTKLDIEKGFVEVETNKFLNKYHSDEIYKSIKKNLAKQYNQTKTEIEDVTNSLKLINNQKKWFDWIDDLSSHIKENRNISDDMKKELLKTVIDFISVDYDYLEKVHRLNINFKIPIVNIKTKKTEYGFSDVIVRPPKSGRKSTDQSAPVGNYSTVTDTSSKANKLIPTKGYSLCLSVELISSNLWTAPYTKYQQKLFNIIRKFHEDDGWNFKLISDWLNENGYKTPRGKVFRQNHVWSIYTKKKRSIQRFNREYDHIITDMRVDVVDYRPEDDNWT